MTKSELIQQLAQRCEIPANRAQLIVTNMFEIMTRNLLSGDKLEIRGFGTFSMKVSKSKLGRNPRTGEKIHVGERRGIAFKTSTILNRRLNQNT